MFLFPGSFRANAKTIRGVNYVVFSMYEGSDLIFDKLGYLMKSALNSSQTVEIPNESLVDNGIDNEETVEV